MADVKWIKLSTQMFEDEKIKLIESMPEADTILVIWVKLLSQAGRVNASGYIYLNENIPYTDEMLATIFNRPVSTIRMALEVFKRFGMIDIDDRDFIAIANWDKHQNVEGMDKIREQNRLRKQKEREAKKLKLAPPLDSEDMSRDSHATVTQNHAIELDKELDKDKDKDIKEPQKNPAEDFDFEFDEFYKIYRKKVDRKKAFDKYKKLRKKFSFETIYQGAEKYMAYCAANKTETKYIKSPLVFLNGENFNDEYEIEPGKGTTGKSSGAVDYTQYI